MQPLPAPRHRGRGPRHRRGVQPAEDREGTVGPPRRASWRGSSTADGDGAERLDEVVRGLAERAFQRRRGRSPRASVRLRNGSVLAPRRPDPFLEAAGARSRWALISRASSSPRIFSRGCASGAARGRGGRASVWPKSPDSGGSFPSSAASRSGRLAEGCRTQWRGASSEPVRERIDALRGVGSAGAARGLHVGGWAWGRRRQGTPPLGTPRSPDAAPGCGSKPAKASRRRSSTALREVPILAREALAGTRGRGSRRRSRPGARPIAAARAREDRGAASGPRRTGLSPAPHAPAPDPAGRSFPQGAPPDACSSASVASGPPKARLGSPPRRPAPRELGRPARRRGARPGPNRRRRRPTGELGQDAAAGEPPGSRPITSGPGAAVRPGVSSASPLAARFAMGETTSSPLAPRRLHQRGAPAASASRGEAGPRGGVRAGPSPRWSRPARHSPIAQASASRGAPGGVGARRASPRTRARCRSRATGAAPSPPAGGVRGGRASASSSPLTSRQAGASRS